MREPLLALASFDPGLQQHGAGLGLTLFPAPDDPQKHITIVNAKDRVGKTRLLTLESTLSCLMRFNGCYLLLGFLGDCLLNFVMVTDGTAHVCEVQISLTKVEVARDTLGGHDSYK